MADITMCDDKDCQRKDSCYRYTATPSKYRQSYFVESPKRKKMGGYDCDYYWRVEDG